ncbi:MAG: NifU family protein [Candidatus Margulisbacteria bacterium]|nr:NifU family protein [Candidatus Margulisiibacteriota bacterium]
MEINAQLTPNPDTLKFLVGISLLEKGSIYIKDHDTAKGSPIVDALYAVEGVIELMIGSNFISVTKSQDKEWTNLVESVTDTLKDVLSKHEGIDDVLKALQSQHAASASEAEAKIKEILDTEIRPAIAMDGGDVVFVSFENGIVMLQLQGACSNCPASTMTLKMGIENRLKEEIPEITEVIAA